MLFLSEAQPIRAPHHVEAPDPCRALMQRALHVYEDAVAGSFGHCLMEPAIELHELPPETLVGDPARLDQYALHRLDLFRRCPIRG
jgi:hypothetical protein